MMKTFFSCWIFLMGLLSVASSLFSQSYPWLSEYDSTQTIMTRFAPPEGFQRLHSAPGSFAEWLQHLPLKEGLPLVYMYNGIEKPNQNAHAAVLDIDVGKADLQQCADAVIRLRAEYLFTRREYAKMHFNYTSGDRVSFSSWVQGYRPIVKNNQVLWMQSGVKGASYKNFREFLVQIFLYAGSASLSQELEPVNSTAEMHIGDVFIKGGFPGHAVIVVDMAENPGSGEKIFMLAQSYMPAQDMHILKNLNEPGLSPWYSIDFGDSLFTPEWTFAKNQLMRFPDH